MLWPASESTGAERVEVDRARRERIVVNVFILVNSMISEWGLQLDKGDV